jgi:hypothetical protein
MVYLSWKGADQYLGAATYGEDHHLKLRPNSHRTIGDPVGCGAGLVRVDQSQREIRGLGSGDTICCRSGSMGNATIPRRTLSNRRTALSSGIVEFRRKAAQERQRCPGQSAACGTTLQFVGSAVRTRNGGKTLDWGLGMANGPHSGPYRGAERFRGCRVTDGYAMRAGSRSRP